MRRHLAFVGVAAAVIASSLLAGVTLDTASAQADVSAITHVGGSSTETVGTAGRVTPGPLLAWAMYQSDKEAAVAMMSPAGMPPYACTEERNGHTWCDLDTGQEWQCVCWWDGGSRQCAWHTI